MKELSIIKRMAAFIEGVVQSTKQAPKAIVISQAQFEELCAEIGKTPDEIEYGAFWGIPLVVDTGESNGASSIQSH